MSLEGGQAGFEDYDLTSKESIWKFSLRLKGKSLSDFVEDIEIPLVAGHKGDFGSLVERLYFRIFPGNSPLPDFPEAGLELKTTGLIANSKGHLQAKERLVLSMIDYMSLPSEQWHSSSFLKKNKSLLLVFYKYVKDQPLLERIFNIAPILFEVPPEDEPQIRADWETIRNKVDSGLAHELSEADTFYLAACRKGQGGEAEALRKQPKSEIGAKARAYSYKPSYVNSILARSGEAANLNPSQESALIQDATKEALMPYLGQKTKLLAQLAKCSTVSKHFRSTLILKLLAERGFPSEKIAKAGVQIKTVRLNRKGSPREHMSFQAFKYLEIDSQNWEDSRFFESLETKFLFAVFGEDANGEEVLLKTMYWNMPFKDREEAHRVWENTKQRARHDANNLPAASESSVAHVRPKARNARDTNTTVYGGEAVTKAFWLNKNYIANIVR